MRSIFYARSRENHAASKRLTVLVVARGRVDRVVGVRRVGAHLVVHHDRSSAKRMAEQLLAHDDDRQARDAAVLLRSSNDNVVRRDLDSTLRR